jgi:L-lactate utilization protein LutB
MDYTQPATSESITRTVDGLKSRNFEPIVVASKEEALKKIQDLIPEGASVMNGASATLKEIGFVEYLKSGNHGWKNLHAPIVAEPDRSKQRPLRNQALFADYYLGSANAVTEKGEIVVVSNTGSQLSHLAFTSPNIILVVGTQKLVPSLSGAFDRIEKYVVDLEDKRLMAQANAHTLYAKTLILHQENPRLGRKVWVILVPEKLGF